ncbi:hypothetical protein [Aquimarina longa]|uniref:hypothetical protein n=1 Tax=Aquimarina longa TaxID=1080221 RepID=UPI000782A267|nr:hypothetical protein [Aquimarina longa]
MKVETYTIKGWEEKETGLLIDENEDWILVKHIPVDYVIDGYRLYRKNTIQKRKSKSKEEKIARVLRLKNIEIKAPSTFKFTNSIDILRWCEQQYGLFEFQDTEASLFYGKLSSATDHIFIIDMIQPDGSIEKQYNYDFLPSDIVSITFETDYFESIRLLMNDELRKGSTLLKI